MMDIWKDLPETETNHDISHFMGRGGAYSKHAWKLPTIPIRNGPYIPFFSDQMNDYSTGRRHDALIYDLEPAEYTVMICAYPEKVSLKLIRLIFQIITFRKKLTNREDFSFIALQRMSLLHHSNNKTRNRHIILYKLSLEIKLIVAISRLIIYLGFLSRAISRSIFEN